MKRTTLATLVAMVLVVVMAVPAFAWHAETGKTKDPDQVTKTVKPAKVKVREFGPKGDPFHRITVNVGKTITTTITTYGQCHSWAGNPEENWAAGTTLYASPAGTNDRIYIGGPGMRKEMRPGQYDFFWKKANGTWYQGRSPENTNNRYHRKTVPACPPAPAVTSSVVREWTPGADVPIHWRFIGRNSPVKKSYSVPENCTFRTGWNYHKGNTKATVKSRGKTLLRYRSGPPGYYGPLYKGFKQGLTCK